MKKLPIVLGILLVAVVSFFPACEVENCPPNALAYAQFAFVDQYGRSVQYTDTLTVIGQLEIADTTIYDTLINKSTNTSTLSLPLSYGEQTRFILQYANRQRDVLTITHRNIPYFINLDCGTMMFYEVTGAETTTRMLDSLVITNPNIDNYEKENFKIYFTISDTNE